MFSASAHLYDLIYAGIRDYAAESNTVAALLRRLAPAARSVLDVACGTGEHARFLADRHGYEVDGLDLDPAFVRIAREKLVRGTVHEAAMIDFDLHRRYDAILCLGSSIGYARTLDGVRAALATFRRHLAPGGVVIVEPWFSADRLRHGYCSFRSVEAPPLKICRMSHTEIDGGISRLRFEYLIGSEGGIERASELHELGLFTHQEMESAFRDAGFESEYDPVGLLDRGLHVARPV